MAQPSPYDYYYGNEADQYTFYRLPKALFTNSRYKGLSDGAKILYGLMLDRMGLSMKNGWLDNQNRVFIYFTLEDVQEYMNCKHEKAVKLLAELDTAKGVGLIERMKQGQGKPTIIYVRKFFGEAEVLTSENQKSGLLMQPQSALPKNRSQDFGKSETNKNELSNPDFNKNNHSYTDNQSIYQPTEGRTPPPAAREMDGIDRINAYRDLILENIEYDIMADRHNRERMDEIVDVMMDAISTKRAYIRIGGDEYPAEVVKSRLLKLTSSHIEYVFDCIDKNTTKVYNIKAYLLTTLYNAPTTIDHYYTTLVNHDMYGQ